MSITQINRGQSKLDIVVHIDELLDEQNRRRIEHAMKSEAGVERAYFNNDRQHLLIVGYDPARTSSQKILKLVRQQRLNAQLIGGL